jgi:predicted MPP superfamily phosphohydrolase
MILLEFVILLGVCTGHIAILAFSNNWWFALALPHRFLTCVRLLHGLLVLAGLVAFGWWYAACFPAPLAGFSGGLGGTIAEAYTLACAVVGLGLVPAVTLAHWLRRRPAVLVSNHTRMVDVAAELGYKPSGRGKHRFLAHLPGNQVFQVDFSERTLRLPRLPAAWDGLTILHLTDLHFCGTPDKAFYQYVMDVCHDWDPDLVAFTGDLVDSDYHHRWILPVLGRLRWRIAAFGILGNHDSWREVSLIRRRLKRAGLCLLSNTWEQIKVRGESLVVIGHEGPWFRPTPDLTYCPDGPFRLCLSHTPDHIRWARQQQVDLMLAGHVHGGQIRFPLIGSVLVPSRYGRRYDCGTFDEPPTVLHVGRGLAGQHPLRYNCRPEVTKIVLKVQDT